LLGRSRDSIVGALPWGTDERAAPVTKMGTMPGKKKTKGNYLLLSNE